MRMNTVLTCVVAGCFLLLGACASDGVAEQNQVAQQDQTTAMNKSSSKRAVRVYDLTSDYQQSKEYGLAQHED